MTITSILHTYSSDILFRRGSSILECSRVSVLGKAHVSRFSREKGQRELMLQQQNSYHNTMTPLIPIHLGAFLKMLRDRHGIAQAEVLRHLPGWQQSAF